MKKGLFVILVLILGGIIGAGGLYVTSRYTGDKSAVQQTTGEKQKGRKPLYYKAPMDPSFVSERPGKSPMGMDLIPVYEGDDGGAEPGTVKIDPVTMQNIGVRTARVRRKRLVKNIRTVGRVTYDEKKVYYLHTKIDGWIEKLYFDFTGQKVKKGDMLLEFYSPKLISAEEEFLLARKMAGRMSEVGRTSLVELSRRRLELWDVPEHQIRELEETGKVKRTLHIQSPATGIIVDKPVTEGMYVKPGQKLYTIADISGVWVYADIYEYELPWIKLGQGADMTLAAYPGEVFHGKVSFIFPFVEPKTRTIRVRIEFDNPGFKLKPDMYADVRLGSVIKRHAVAVPKEAVLLSGKRSLVILSLGHGKFRPRDIVLGTETEDYFEVRSGLKEGDIVVTSAQFLIDSESSLKEAVSKMLEAKKAKSSEKAAPKKGMKMDGQKKDMKMDGHMEGMK
ncbi:MAG: efflux RND transporter periplasmic adaptor subunit [Thermodesulfobacteriota bacterium]